MINDEKLVRDYLAADAGIIALVGARVYTQLPASPTFPLVVLFRIGGYVAANDHLDGVRLQIEAWSDPGARPAAAELFRAIRTAMRQIAIAGTHTLGVVTGAEEVNALWLPDPVTGRPRYIVDSRVWMHEAAA